LTLAARLFTPELCDSHPHDSPYGKASMPVAVRAVCGKSVQAELDNLGQRYQDIVVDADWRDCLGSRAELTSHHGVLYAIVFGN
jgi:hypothetical protein